jgi:hypothetical protein
VCGCSASIAVRAGYPSKRGQTAIGHKPSPTAESGDIDALVGDEFVSGAAAAVEKARKEVGDARSNVHGV